MLSRIRKKPVNHYTSRKTSLKQCVLITKVFSYICLMENDDCCRIQFSGIHGRPGSNTKPQRNVIHIENDHTLMFWRIFGYPAQMRLYNVVSVEERHLTVWLNPHLVFCILSKIVKSCDVQLEFVTFAEFSETCSEACEIGPCNRYTKAHQRLGYIVYSIFMEPKAVWFVWDVNEMDKVLSNVICQFGKHQLALLFRQRSHRNFSGSVLGKFNKSGKFKLHITALDYLARYAKFKIWIKPNGEMPFLYGNHVVKAHLGRITEDTPEHQGVVVYSMNDTPLGFGVTARSTIDTRKLDPTAIIVFHQADVGEYLRDEDTLF